MLGLVGLLVLGCGPDKRECSGSHPGFQVALQLESGPLTPDTVVDVAYGGTGKDQYSLANPDANHEVIFCEPAHRDCVRFEAGAPAASDSAGASGDDPAPIESLCCDLWTSGYTRLKVSASGLETSEHDLYPKDHVCTVKEVITLDGPDAG